MTKIDYDKLGDGCDIAGTYMKSSLSNSKLYAEFAKTGARSQLINNYTDKFEFGNMTWICTLDVDTAGCNLILANEFVTICIYKLVIASYLAIRCTTNKIIDVADDSVPDIVKLIARLNTGDLIGIFDTYKSTANQVLLLAIIKMLILYDVDISYILDKLIGQANDGVGHDDAIELINNFPELGRTKLAEQTIANS